MKSAARMHRQWSRLVNDGQCVIVMNNSNVCVDWWIDPAWEDVSVTLAASNDAITGDGLMIQCDVSVADRLFPFFPSNVGMIGVEKVDERESVEAGRDGERAFIVVGNAAGERGGMLTDRGFTFLDS